MLIEIERDREPERESCSSLREAEREEQQRGGGVNRSSAGRAGMSTDWGGLQRQV